MKNTNKKLEWLDNKVQIGRWTHQQHSTDFLKEINKPNQVQEPFRILDEKWNMGKFKGTKIQDTPQHYIKWVLKNFTKLSKSHKIILEKYLTQEK